MLGRISCAFALLLAAPFVAQAQPLKVVEVSAPDINCVYRANCIIPVADSSAPILLPTINPGDAFLQSRTFTGEAGTPAGANTVGYEYRISMTAASGMTDCIVSFVLNFGPNKQLPFKNNTLADVYVTTGGGLGTIGLASATRYGDVIEFILKSALCVNGPASVANTTYFIGIAATAAPMHVEAEVAVIGTTPIYAVDARVPTHAVAQDPPGGL